MTVKTSFALIDILNEMATRRPPEGSSKPPSLASLPPSKIAQALFSSQPKAPEKRKVNGTLHSDEEKECSGFKKFKEWTANFFSKLPHSVPIPPLKGRKEMRKIIANTTLKEVQALGLKTNWRQFAAMHCPGIIKNTSLEGEYFESCIYSAWNFFDTCLQGEGSFFSIPLAPKIKNEVMEEISQALKNMAEFLPFRYAHVPTTKENLENLVDECFNKIKAIHDKLPIGKKVVHLPMGYRHGAVNQPHAIVYKITEIGNEIEIRFLNLGNGCGPNPVLDYTVNQEKRSLSSVPILLPKEEFYNGIGRQAFCYLFRYQLDLPPSSGDPYDGDDINDIFFGMLSSSPNARIGPLQKEYAASVQISGTCAETAVNNVLQDVLISNDIPEIAKQKIFLNRYFCSLITHFLEYERNPNCHPSAQVLLQDACKSLSAMILDFHNNKQIGEQELIASASVLDHISKKFQLQPPSIPHEIATKKATFMSTLTTASTSSSSSSSSAQTSAEAVDLSSLALKPSSSKEPLKAKAPVSEKRKPIAFYPPQVTTAQAFPAELRRWIGIASTLPKKEVYRFVSSCAQQLPIPINDQIKIEKALRSHTHALETNIWDDIPVDQITDVLLNFKHLLSLALRKKKVAYTNQDYKFIDQFMMIYTFYAVADKLTRRCKDTRLEGFETPFLPYPYTYQPYGFTCLPLKEDNERYTQLLHYFTGKRFPLERGCEKQFLFTHKKMLFPIAPVLDIDQFVSDHRENRYDDITNRQGKNQVEYLSQFLQNPRSNPVSNYCEQWMSSLPPQVQVLYYLSFLSHLLFSAVEKKFPPSLEFAFKETKSGKPGLKIVGAEFHTKDDEINDWDGASYKLTINRYTLFTGDRCRKPETIFFWNFLPYNYNHSFFRKYLHLDTNHALCETIDEMQQTRFYTNERDMHTLLNITRHANLSFQQVLQEFSLKEKQHLLSSQLARPIIEGNIFQPFFLLQRLRDTPDSTISGVRNFVEQGLAFYGLDFKHIHTLFLLLDIGTCFETFTPETRERQETLTSYQRLIQTLLRKKSKGKHHVYWNSLNLAGHFISLTRLRDQALFEAASLEEISTLFANLYESLVYAHFHVHESPALNNLPRLIYQLSYRCYSLLRDEHSRNAICNTIVHQLLKEDREVPFELSSSDTWKGSFPEFSCDKRNLTLNFFNGKLTHMKHGVLSGESIYFPDQKDYIWVLVWKNKKREQLTLNERMLCCSDQWYKLVTNLQGLISKHPIDRREETSDKFLKLHDESKSATLFPPSKSSLSSRSNEEASHQSMLSLKDEFHQLPVHDADLVEIDLHRVTNKHPLYPYTIKLVDPDFVSCFTLPFSKKEGNPVGIAKLSFHRHGLLFKYDGKGLKSQITGSYLIATEQDLLSLDKNPKTREIWLQLLEEIDYFERAFILYNPELQKWHVLIAHSILEQGKEDFSRKVFASTYSDRIYLFEYDTIEDYLKNAAGETIFLAALFKMQRNYKKALKYLYKVDPFTVSSNLKMLELFNNFKDVKDYSPAAQAFDLKVCLHLICSKNAMIEERFLNSTHTDDFHKFIVWGLRVFTSYRRLYDNGLLSQVPKDLLLSDSEDKMLMIAFRADYLEKPRKHPWEKAWREDDPLLDLRYNILLSKQRAVKLAPEPQSVSLCPPLFSFIKEPKKYSFEIDEWVSVFENYNSEEASAKKKKVEVPSYPVRITSEALLANFPQLYEEVRQVPPGIDLKLQGLLKVDNWISAHRHMHSAAALLFWVRHFSHRFKGLSLAHITGQGDSEDYRRILKLIIARVNELDSEAEPYKKFTEEYLKLGLVHKMGEITFEIPKPVVPHEPIQVQSLDRIAALKLPDDLEARKEGLEQRIYSLFNGHFKRIPYLTANEVVQEAQHLLQKCAEQVLSVPKKAYHHRSVLPHKIMHQVILKNDLAYLHQQRSMLSKDEMLEICSLVCEWYHTCIKLKLKKENKEHLYLPYDPQRYPEISSFVLDTGKFPRKEQLKVYKFIEAGIRDKRHRHFQLPAGAGKTDVLTPLIILGAKKSGLMPVNVVTGASYPIDKNNLGYNLRLLNEQQCYLEVGMHMIDKLSERDLEFIFSQLKQYKDQGKSLIISRDTYFALFLIRELAHRAACVVDDDAIFLRPAEEIGAKIRWSQRIVNFFEQNCLLIGDESHVNGDAMSRSVYGTGKFFNLPEHESAHLLSLMKLFGKSIPSTSSFTATSSSSSSSSSSSMTQESSTTAKQPKKSTAIDVDVVRKSLAKECLSFFPAIPAGESQAFLAYWTDINAPQPQLLRKLRRSNPETASEIALTGYFLIHLLPECLTMRTDVDHARSLYPDRMHEVPAHNRIVSSAEYEDFYKTCILSIKGFIDRGLGQIDLRELLQYMLSVHTEEQKRYFLGETPTSQLFKKWLEHSDFYFTTLQSVDTSSPVVLEGLGKVLRKQPNVLDYFFKHLCFKGIGSSAKQLTCTTTDLYNGFAGTISFSATPRSELAYPRCLRRGPDADYFKDPAFEADVKEKLLDTKLNGRRVVLEDNEDFWTAIKSKHQDILQEATILIDPRGFFPGISNKQLAEQWLEQNKTLQGVLYCTDERSLKADRKEEICLLQRDGTIVRNLNPQDIEASFKKNNLDWNSLKIGTIYDPARTESLHITQKEGAVAFYFLGDGLTTSHLIQSVMRLRDGFTRGTKTIVQVSRQSLDDKIFKGKDPNADLLLRWTDFNANEQEEKRIILNAFAEIHYAIAKEARREIQKAHDIDTTPEMYEVIKVYKQYANGLVEGVIHDAYALFADHERLEPIRKILGSYAQALYLRFNYKQPYEGNHEVLKEIDDIIKGIEQAIPLIYGKANQDMSKTVEQQMQIKTLSQRMQKNQSTPPYMLSPLPGNYGEIGVNKPEYLNAKKTSGQFISTFITQNLFFLENYYRTGIAFGLESKVLFLLKPIHCFMIMLTKDGDNYRWQAWVDSDEITSSQRLHLLDCEPKIDNLKHTAFLVAADGRLDAVGTGALTPPEEEVQKVLKSEWLQDLILDHHLLRGRILDPKRLLARVRKTGWAVFDELWKIVVQIPFNSTEKAYIEVYKQVKEHFINGTEFIEKKPEKHEMHEEKSETKEEEFDDDDEVY